MSAIILKVMVIRKRIYINSDPSLPTPPRKEHAAGPRIRSGFQENY
jgi:hypothetical protein